MIYFPDNKAVHHTYYIFLGSTQWMEITSIDVRTNFLNGYLEENVFMCQLEGFVVKKQE